MPNLGVVAVVIIVLAFKAPSALAGLKPVALCKPLLSICTGDPLTAESIGSNSFDPDRAGNLTLSLDFYGPWYTPGLKSVQLTVRDQESKTSSRKCFFRVKLCPTSQPSSRPSPRPSSRPSSQPSLEPSSPSQKPSLRPSENPTVSIAPSKELAYLTCPSTPTDPPVVIDPSSVRSAKFALSAFDQLCTLTWVSPDGAISQPVSRSYLGNAWEPYSGPFASIPIACSDTYCIIKLPTPLSPPTSSPTAFNYTFQLTSYSHTLPPRDEWARFLETTTFGPTRAELSQYTRNASSSVEVAAMADWIQQQMQLPVTSHRQFFRERATGRYEFLSSMGAVTHPCQSGARYRNYAFSLKDASTPVKIVLSNKTSQLILSVRNQVRTVVSSVVGQFVSPNSTVFTASFATGSSYAVCGTTQEFLGGRFRLTHPTYGCTSDTYFGSVIGNPLVQFSNQDMPSNDLLDLSGLITPVDQKFYENMTQEVVVLSDFSSTSCAKYPNFTGYPERIAVGFTGSGDSMQYWLFSPTFDLQENSLTSPMADGGGVAYTATKSYSPDSFRVRCANVPRTFLNEDKCVLSSSLYACQSKEFPDVSIPLEISSFRTIHQVSGGAAGGSSTRYVYTISQLRQDIQYNDPPCKPGTRSRWIPSCAGTGNKTIANTTAALFRDMIKLSQDDNPYLLDAYFPTTGAACHPNDTSKFDFAVVVDGQCWLNVHPDTYQVYDFTYWTTNHPGNTLFRNPIKEFAELNKTFHLLFPASHGMDRWVSNKARFGNVGRLGDKVNSKDLPSTLLNDAIAYAFGGSDIITGSGPVMVCGSPFEMSNDPKLYGLAGRSGFDVATQSRMTTLTDAFVDQRTTIWMEIALRSLDQLRQRVAWALSQILVVAPDSIAVKEQTENFVTYYDIFVRNAFGNYRDVLKEVSYSPMMAEMLSYLGSKSTAFTWSTQKTIEFADENYAREVMQLFSVGLYKLNRDGTRMTADDGSFVRCYSNSDITQYARAWTGFTRQNTRANIEDMTDPTTPDNQVDPMLVNVDWRDQLPKMGLDGKYIGDGLPLCSDLPPQHFLKMGAKFRQLGSSPKAQLLAAFVGEGASVAPSRFILDPASTLYKKLCNAPPGGSDCRYAPVVILDESLPCFGDECEINALRVFEAEPGIYFEYIRRPCAHQAFANDAKMVKTLGDGRDIMCAKPASDLASTTCCQPGNDGTNGSTRIEKFSGERVPYWMAESRCAAIGMSVCLFPALTDCQSNGGCDPSLQYWTNSTCRMKAKIDIDGNVALVHVAGDSRVAWNYIGSTVQERTVSFFRVEWSGSVERLFANYTAECVAMGCNILPFDNLCICDAFVDDSAPFSTSTKPTREQVLSELHLGALPPNTTGIPLVPGVIMYGSGLDAVFETIDDYGITQYRKNLKSIVRLGLGGISFRNPVHIIALSDPELRDAHYETDATIDHYMYHPNTAPFLAIRFAQRFGISNPSPRYIETIGDAFRSGQYIFDDEGVTQSFGSGQYGDLGAMVAAVLLDREARAVVLDADPVQGSLQEPFLKIMRLMRSLEYKASDDYPLIRVGLDLQDAMGQEPHKLPDVFSFFKPEYQPAGPVSDSGLVSPESQVLNGPKSISMVNTMLAYLKYGLKNCFEGFGVFSGSCILGTYQNAYGYASYSANSGLSPRGIVDELATILTSGRLSLENRAIVESAYNLTIKTKPPSEALINAEQLIALTPEFHARGTVRPAQDLRSNPPAPPQSTVPYKAVIYLFLDGGYDSYSMMVPHRCSGTNAAKVSAREQYDTLRGVLAFLEGPERSVIINATGQPCESFALHDELTYLKELYENNELNFFANAGQIDRNGLTKFNYQDLSVSQLFSHNSMQQEAWVVDPFAKMPGTGILGRSAELLAESGYKVNSIAIDNLNVAVTGKNGGVAPDPLIVGRTSVTTFSPRPNRENYFDVNGYVAQLNKQSLPRSNIFSETWSRQLSAGIYEAAQMQSYLSSANLSSIWNPASYAGNSGKQAMYQKLNTIAKLIKTHNRRGTDRDVFFTSYGSWDHHAQTKANIRPKFNTLNYALRLFIEEMKNQSMWENVTIVVASEFARTITANSGAGCDHAWGGHYFMMGGSVKGGRVLGKYPNDITDESPLTLGRGRIIPTTSWDAIWNGVVEWLGVKSKDLDQCLPNRNNTVDPDFPLFSKADLYR